MTQNVPQAGLGVGVKSKATHGLTNVTNETTDGNLTDKFEKGKCVGL